MSEPDEEGKQPAARHDLEEDQPQSGGAMALLSSMRFALGLVCAIAVACVVATLLPQGNEVAQHMQKHPEAARWLKRLAAGGLTNVFSSWWFIGLLGALGASLAACIGRRLRLLFRGTGMAKVERLHVTGTLLVHGGLLLTLIGGAIRILFAEQGVLQLREGEATATYLTEENPREPLPFTLQLVKFEIEHYPVTPATAAAAGIVQSETVSILQPGEALGDEWKVTLGAERDVVAKSPSPGTNRVFRVKLLRREPDFVFDPTSRVVRSRSSQMLNPALLVRVTDGTAATARWLFARFPDFDMNATPGQESRPLPFKLNYQVMVSEPEKPHIKSFKSTLRILKAGVVTREQTIEVNAPLSSEGYTFYQSGYNEEDLSSTVLRVVRDPSVPTVYIGFILLCVGALLTAG